MPWTILNLNDVFFQLNRAKKDRVLCVTVIVAYVNKLAICLYAWHPIFSPSVRISIEKHHFCFVFLEFEMEFDGSAKRKSIKATEINSLWKHIYCARYEWNVNHGFVLPEEHFIPSHPQMCIFQSKYVDVQ